MKVTDMSYGQFLLNTQANYTGTYFADMVSGLDHNSVYRYLKHAKMAPRMIWEKTSQFLEPSEDGYVIFDDTVADKLQLRHRACSFAIQRKRPRIVKVSGSSPLVLQPRPRSHLCTRLPHIARWDGKTKLDHVVLDHRPFKETRLRTVLMDSWYADGHDTPTKVLERRSTAPQIKSVGS